MAERQTPTNETLPHTPRAVVPFVEKSEAVQRALSLPDAKDWKGLMQIVASDIPTPEAAKVSAASRLELSRRYQTLSQERFTVAQSLNAVVALSMGSKEIDPVLQANVLRALGTYLDRLDVYTHMMAGKIPSGTRLPPYLSKYVSTREEEQFAARVTGYMLPLQYDVRDRAGLQESPQKLAPLTNEVVMGAVRLKLRMATVLACAPGGALATDRAAYEQFLDAAGFAPHGQEQHAQESIDAAKFLVGYVLKYRKDIQRYADIRSGGVIENLTIAEALECAAQASAVGDLAREVALNAKGLIDMQLPDMRSFVSDLFEKGDFMPERMVQVALAPLAALSDGTAREREHFEENAKAVFGFFRSIEAKNYSVGRLDSYIHNFNEPQRQMMLRLADHIAGPAHAAVTVDRLLRASFVTTDAAAQDPIEQEIAATLQSLIAEQKLSARDAFDLYYLLETKGSDVLIAYKVVHILDSYGDQRLATELQVRILRSLVTIATGDEKGVASLAKEFQWSDENRIEMSNIRQYLSEAGVDAIEHWYQRLWSFTVNFPEIAIPLELLSVSGVVTPAGLVGWKVYNTLRVGKLDRFANMGPVEARNALRIPANVPNAQIRLAQREVAEILGEYDRLGRRFHLLRGGKVLRQGDAILRAASSDEMTDMAAALKKRFSNPADVADQLTALSADGDRIRSALKGAGFAEADTEQAMRAIADKLTTLSEQSSLTGEVRGVQEALRQVRFDQLASDADLLSRDLDQLMELKDAAARRTAMDAWIERAKQFQARTNDLAKAMPEARRQLAEKIIGKTTLGDDGWQVIEAMHRTETIEGKMKILLQAELPPERTRALKKLMRIGIAGETDDVLKTARALTAARSSKLVLSGAVTLQTFVAAYLIIENRQRIAQARRVQDRDTVRILEDRERSLVLASAGGLSSALLSSVALAMPATVALTGGTWYADTLYEHAITLNTSTLDHYVQEPSATLFYNALTLPGFETTDLAGTNGKETRDIRRSLMLEAILRKRITSPAGVRAGMAVLDFLTREGDRRTFDLAALESKGAVPPAEAMVTALDVAALYEERDRRIASGQPLAFASIDLTSLPKALEGQRTDVAIAAMTQLGLLAQAFRSYRLEQARTLSLAGSDLQAPAETASIVRPVLYDRVAADIAYADGRVAHAFTGVGFDLKRDAALYELRAVIEGAVDRLMEAMHQQQNTLPMIQAIEETLQRTLRTVDPKALYDAAEVTIMTSPRFNPLRYAIDHIDTSLGGPFLSIENMESRLGPVRAARQALEKKLGVPLQDCVSALIDRRPE